MYNLYTTSTVSLRTRASPSFSLIDHPSYSIPPSHNARHSSSSSCCNCNCCCSLPVNCVTSCGLVPINPTLTYGFRQSTLIQWPSSRRRFILTSADRCGFDDPGRTRIPYRRLCCIKDAGADSMKDGSSLKEKGIELWGYRKRVFQERLVFRRIASACEDAEAMISLLTDEVGQELLNLYGRAKDNAVKGKCNYRKGNGLECEEAENRKESYRTRSWEDDLGRGEYSRLTKQLSGDSSYYSCSDSGDYESDSEVVATTHQFLGNSREDDVEERKKYTKKHTGDSFGQAASRKTSNINQARRSEAHVRAEEASRTSKQYSLRGEESISDLNSTEVLRSGYSRNDKQVSGTSKSRYKYERLTGSSDRVHEKSTGSSKKEMVGEENVVSNCEFCATCGQASLGDQTRSESEQRSKFSQIQESNINLVSNIDTQANSRNKRMEEGSTLLQMSANELNQQQDLEHHVASGQMSSQNYAGSSDAAQSYEDSTNLFRRHVKHFEAQNTDARLTSTAKQQSNTRINRQEATSTSLQTSLEDVNENIHQENLVATSQTNLIRKSQNRSSRENAGVSFIQNSSRTQKEEARMKSSEESMAVKINIPSQHAKGGQIQTVTEIGSQNQYTNASEDVSVGSQAHIHETTRSASRKKSNHKQSYLNESVTSAEQRIEQCEQVEERLKQTDFRYDLERPCREVSYHEKGTSNPYRTSTSQIQIEEIGDKEHDENQARLAPRTQSIERDPVYAESASRLIKGDSSQSSEGDSGIYIYPQATGVSPSGQEQSQLISHVDLLGSAERQNRSSLQFTGDFVDKARHQASTSASHMEKKLPKMHLVDEESTQSAGENHELRKQYSRRPSSSGTTKGPTEEIWGVQEPRPREGTYQATAAPADSAAERSGRTLWNVIADIALFRWGSRAESNRSPVKSGVKSSSSDSLKSEAWFSGQDPDEAKGSDMNRSTSSRVPESTSTDRPLLIRTPTQSSTEQFTLLSTGDDAGPDVHNALSSSGGISGETNLELNVEEVEETSQATSTTSVDWSQPAAGLFRRSHRSYFATLEMQEGGNEAVGNVRMDQIQDDLNSSLTEASGSGDNAELERRKLLRNKQVVRERFEEWEEAYKVENEQRKMDEIFMREALEEAKKAADIWEVPVGAVLVHDGKIIARGYNLVEDLRDSTAHAEMICIREGSNVLKAWRLSDTTLYVTLEPCAMCAGAILQARIGTLVYGAPNKLLGADGSWIRLFPSRADRDGRSESSTGKAEGPVHPFHTKMTIRRGILETECSDAMQQFFRLRRKKDKKTEQGVQQSSSKKMIHPSKLLNKMHHVFHFLFCL